MYVFLEKQMIKKSLLFFILFFLFLFSFTKTGFCVEVDGTSLVTNIIDGDTFDVYTDDTIRLADINTPELDEPGGQEAKDFLSDLIYMKPVYLDIDDYYQFDTTGTRIVCVVYTYYNSTHLLNVNKVLLNEGYAVIDNNDNEFDPNSWSLYVLNPTTSSPSPTPTISPAPTITPTPTTSPIISPSPTETPQPSTSPIDPLVLGLIIVIVILGSAILFLLFRKK